MAQSISDNFQAALIHLLETEGRGAQSRLARQQHIDKGYLSAIIKGRKPGSEEARSKIAAYFQLTYEEMLALGRSLLETSVPPSSGDDAPVDASKRESKPLITELPDRALLVREEELRYHASPQYREKTQKVNDILSAQDVYSKILEGFIDVVYEASIQNVENQALKKRITELESRLIALEKRWGAS
ncbi:hypothetical protein [Desulfogranum marinum]|uniref:hypothetical protein n=1 Tax=Desulfogranum marinum TaxID=453220 RepID=UPI0019649A72|nr:hypothetical protein [Desulfogranum marinum]MBM9514053.1 hypothetical protein [Desulfogranum marinum]